MSARAAAYELQNFSPKGYAVLANGVRFDAYVGHMLVEVKGPGYAKLLNGKFGNKVLEKLLDQARRQSKAYGGKIEWRFAEGSAASAFKKALGRQDFGSNITVRNVPAKSGGGGLWGTIKSWFNGSQ